MPKLAALTAYLTPIAIGAAILALIVPSSGVAGDSDLLLALLVLLTALGISAGELKQLRRHTRAIAFLSIVPLPLLGVLAWALGRPFGADVQHGLLGTGLASSEVASVGLVALAGADATFAVGVVTGSLIASAVLGPLLIGVLAGSHASHVNSVHLLGRFGLVVILPLIIGVAIRSTTHIARYLTEHDEDRDGLASLTVAALVYASLSGTADSHGLGWAALAAALFLGLSALLGGLPWYRAAHTGAEPQVGAVPGAFTITMRDFAVAATLATQAFGAQAGTVPGIYGVLMLVAASAAAGLLRR